MSTPADLTQTCPVVSDILGPVFEELKIVAPGLNVYGPSEDAANSSPPAIWWCLTNESFGPSQRAGQAGAPGLLAVREVSVAFLIFGGEPAIGDYPADEMTVHDCDKTEILKSHLENVFQRRLGGAWWKVTSCQWFNGGHEGIGLSVEETIVLHIPLLREDNPTVRPTAAQIGVQIGTT